MWKKVLYLGVAVIFGILVYIFAYQSNQYGHITDIVMDAIENEKYEEVAKVFGGCFDTHTIVEDDSDKLDLVIYPATSLIEESYYPNEDETQKYLKYENAYYVYLFKSNFSYGNTTSSSGDVTNATGLMFYSGENEFKYNFVVSDQINSKDYIETPKTPAQVVMNKAHNVTSSQADWHFMTLTVTELMITEMTVKLGGDIDSIAIIDNLGEVVYKTNVALDFSQTFFKDVEPLVTNYNVYLTAYQNAENDDARRAAEEKFIEFYGKDGEEDNGWVNTTFKTYKETKGYTFRYDNDYLVPGSLVWQTIGVLALYLVVVALFYILLFHFKTLRRIFSRESYKDYSNDDVIINGKKVQRNKNGVVNNKAKANEEKPALDKPAEPTVEEVKVEEPVVEPKEEAPAEKPKKTTRKPKTPVVEDLTNDSVDETPKDGE